MKNSNDRARIVFELSIKGIGADKYKGTLIAFEKDNPDPVSRKGAEKEVCIDFIYDDSVKSGIDITILDSKYVPGRRIQSNVLSTGFIDTLPQRHRSVLAILITPLGTLIKKMQWQVPHVEYPKDSFKFEKNRATLFHVMLLKRTIWRDFFSKEENMETLSVRRHRAVA